MRSRLAGWKAALSRSRILWVVAVAGIPGGCLTSEKPLITDNAVYPIAAGSVFETYEVSDDRMSPKLGADGKIVTGTLDIVEGFYKYASSEEKPALAVFRVAEIANTPYFIAMHPNTSPDIASGAFYYSLIERRGEFFISYSFAKGDFDRYREAMEKAAAGRWALYTAGNPWRITDDEKSVQIDSLPFLEAVLPEMAAGGFYFSATAYKPID